MHALDREILPLKNTPSASSISLPLIFVHGSSQQYLKELKQTGNTVWLSFCNAQSNHCLNRLSVHKDGHTCSLQMTKLQQTTSETNIIFQSDQTMCQITPKNGWTWSDTDLFSLNFKHLCRPTCMYIPLA